MKRQILQLLGFVCTLDLRDAATTNFHELHLSNCRLSGGWYMIEASPDQISIGSTITIQTFIDGRLYQLTGKQCLQLGNTHTAKRLMWLSERSNFITLSNHTSKRMSDQITIKLIRVTQAFATSRIIHDLAARQNVDDDDIADSIDLPGLYQRYSRKFEISDVATEYRYFPTIRQEISDSKSHKNSNLSPLSDQYQIICTDIAKAEQTSDNIQAPFVILTTSTVCLSETFENLLDSVSNDESDSGNKLSLWYTDHDHTTEHGERVYPCFKPAWNKGLLLQGNYVGPFLICKTELYRQMGGVDLSLGDSAIFDFLLRVASKIDEKQVRRIPKIGYTLPQKEFRPPHGFYIGTKDDSVIDSYLQRNASSNVTISPGIYPGIWQVGYELAGKQPSVDILIPTRDHVDLLEQCVNSIIAKTDYSNYTITVIDNDSSDPCTHAFHKRMCVDKRYRMISYAGDFNYSAINNLAAYQSDASILILLNNDTEVLQSDWMKRIVEELTQDDIACVGTRLLYPNGLIQHAGIVPGLQGVAGHINRFATNSDDGYAAAIQLSADVSAVTGACLGIRRSVYKELGGLNSGDLKVAYNDVDLCLRARNAGFRNRYLANVALVHHESVSRGMDNDTKKMARFRSEIQYMELTHAAWIHDDPAWNPNFSRLATTPTLIKTPTQAT